MRRVVLLVLFGLALGALLTGIAGVLPGSHGLDALTWLSTVSTVAALVVAVGIFRVQQTQSDAAHQELLDALKAQDEILQDLTDTTPQDVDDTTQDPTETRPATVLPAPAKNDDALTDEQRKAVEAQYGDGSIESVGKGKHGRGNRARLVTLVDGTLVAVFNDGRGDVRMREIEPRRERGRSPRDRRSRSPESR